jgi:hypothetical protein
MIYTATPLSTLVARIFQYLHSNAEEGEGLSWGDKNDEFNWIMECEDENEGLKPGNVVHLKSKCRDAGGGAYRHSNGEDGASWGERVSRLQVQ